MLYISKENGNNNNNDYDSEFKETCSDFLKQVERELRESLIQLLAIQ